MDSTIWSRRTNSGKLSLSTSGGATAANGSGAGDSSGSASGSASATTNRSFAKRFGDSQTSSHSSTKRDPFSSLPTPGGSLVSPGGAANAFGLGSGAFASFGSAKTPKTTGNPYESTLGGASGGASVPKTPGTEKSAREASTGGTRTMGKQPSSGSLASVPESGPAPPTAAGGKSSAGAAKQAQSRPPVHRLRSSWMFWFRPPISKANGFVEYEKTLHPIATCETAEEFFEIYRHLKRPSSLPLVSDYHLFKKGVRPIWEDEENKSGGKWIVRMKKGVADRYWEDLLLALIGDQFGEASDEVCGAVLSVRNGEDILSIWAKSDGGRVLKIREIMKRVLAFPPDTKIEWKSHDQSIQQRTAIEESRREKREQHHQHSERRTSNSAARLLDDSKHQ